MTFPDGQSQRPARLRAEGVRLAYWQVSPQVREWVEQSLSSPVVDARTLAGGMSPGCAARLCTDDGQVVFLKAVGGDLNPDTPQLFRHEVSVLRVLPGATYRPGLIDAYDDGDWVGLLLDHVDGRHPDFADDDDAAAAWRTIRAQATELTPAPAGLDIMTIAEVVRGWAGRWNIIMENPADYLPGWAVARADAMHDRIARVPDEMGGRTLCHWDVRNDNMLIRPGGQAVIFDWGMARIGPAWTDELSLSLEWAGSSRIDRYLAEISGRHGEVSARLLTDLMIAFAGSQAWRARQAVPPGLPSLPGLCAGQAARLFRTIRRRISA